MMLDLSHPDISPHQPGRVSSLVTAHQCPYTAATDGTHSTIILKIFWFFLYLFSSCCCDLYWVGRVCDTGLREDIQEHGQTGLHLRREENSGSWESHQVEPLCVFQIKFTLLYQDWISCWDHWKETLQEKYWPSLELKSSVFDTVMYCVTDLFVYLLTFTALFTPTELCNKYLYFHSDSNAVVYSVLFIQIRH